MKLQKSFALALIITLFSIAPAQANGYITWKPPVPATKDFNQDISIDKGLPNTLWKSQVYLGNRKMLAIEVGVKSDGMTYAQFMVYFDQGFSHVGMPGNTCTSDISRDIALDSILSCRVSVDVPFPTRLNMNIIQESRSEYSSRWSAYVTPKTGGSKVKVGTFDFANPEASITSVTQYSYPVWMSTCEMTSPKQSAIYWQPSSLAGNYSFDNFYNNNCGPYQFILPESTAHMDGISVTISAETPKVEKYQFSVNEILNPEVWKSAFQFGRELAEVSAEARLQETRSQLQGEIQVLSDQVKELTNSNASLLKKLTKTITCTKGKLLKQVTGINPACAKGWTLKR